MLSTLSIRDIVLIDRLDLVFAPGLTALTGETGAGKSILLDALTLALGGRGDANLVRAGQDQGQVIAAFDVPMSHPARRFLEDSDFPADGDIILRRVQNADGRTRAFVNDQPVSMQFLRELATRLVEIHGQHDDRALVDPSTHRRLLDAFGGHAALTGAVREAWRDWQALEKARSEAAERLEAARRDEDYLRHAVEELVDLAPQEGEEEALAERRQAMLASEKLADDLNDALSAVSGEQASDVRISAVLRKLERRRADLPGLLDPLLSALDEALRVLDEARLSVEDAMRAAAFDPSELERVEERLFALRALARKHSVSVDDLPALHARMETTLRTIDSGEEELKELEDRMRLARDAYVRAAAELSAARREAAGALDAAVNAELSPLRLDTARFTTLVETGSPESGGPSGVDQVAFHVQTNPGTRPGPILKVASGGELSRFLLALKVCLADRGSAPTLVFDEIDTGVGGAVSDAIGQRLSRLAEKVQVITVTHAPQVAARAGEHLLIAKSAAAAHVVTRVRRLEDGDRREEIARMLAGATITEEARAAADRLIALAS
jgi:DNA repair protein RecN (Recombination protein N)